MTESSGERREHQGDEGVVPADTFSLRLAIARFHAGRLSIEQAARMCGLSPGNWAHWEDGRRPREQVEIVQAISEGLGVSFNWLLLGGPLVPARGKPTKRPGSVTVRKPILTVRPLHTHPSGRDDSSRSKSSTGAGRRAAPVW